MIGSAVKTDAQKKTARQLKEWALMTLGTLLLASGVYFFKFPKNLLHIGWQKGIEPGFLFHQFRQCLPISGKVGYLKIGREQIAIIKLL